MTANAVVIAFDAEDLPVLDLALVVAKPKSRAMYLSDAGGKKVADGGASIERAVQSGRAFAVDPDDDLLICDVDAPEGAANVDQLVDILHQSNLTPIVVASGSRGHFHLFVRVPDEAALLRLTNIARALKCVPRNRQRIRPPLSPHPAGWPVYLVTPSDPSDALIALKRPAQLRLDHERLSAPMYALLRFGPPDKHRYRSRSEVIMAIALGAVNAHWSFEYLFVALRDTRNIGGVKVQEMKEANARRYVLGGFQKATEYAKTHPPIADRAEVEDIIDAALSLRAEARWSGVAGATDWNVLGAHLEIARLAGSTQYTASTRQLAERSGVLRNTASRANERLVTDGWLHLVAQGRGSKASTWKLRDRRDHGGEAQTPQVAQERTITSHAPEGGGLTGAFLRASDDAFRWRALGKNGRRIMESLASRSLTNRELVQLLNIHRTTVKNNLVKLRDAGLVDIGEDGTWRIVSDDQARLDKTAEWFGTNGRGDRQRRQHHRERATYLDLWAEYVRGFTRPLPSIAKLPSVTSGTGQTTDRKASA